MAILSFLKSIAFVLLAVDFSVISCRRLAIPRALHPSLHQSHHRQKIQHAHLINISASKKFVPLHVAIGSQVVYVKDRSSQLAFHGQAWRKAQFGDDTGEETTQVGDSVELNWTGEAIECFGAITDKDDNYDFRALEIYLDGKPQSTQEVFRNRPGPSYTEGIIFGAHNLSLTSHTLKIIHKGDKGELFSIFAFVITNRNQTSQSSADLQPELSFLIQSKKQKRATLQWTLEQEGDTGVAAMQLSVVSDTHAIIIDRSEHNPLMTQGHSAWAALYNLETHEVRALNPVSNSFCAGGSFLANGTLVNIGGSAAAAFKKNKPVVGDISGLQSIRLFTPCEDGNCDIVEFPNKLNLTSPRWYPGTTRLADGSIMIVGGSTRAGWKNSASINNPTIEYFPPKQLDFASKLPIHSPFLVRTLDANLFPLVITLPTPDMVFVAANNDAMLYNWRTGVENRLPSFPNGVRVTYPFTGSGILLPLTYRNHYEAEILICGGSNISDSATQEQVKVSDPASDQCVRMVLNNQGIANGWTVEHMPQPRIMPDLVIMPDGKILIVNGGMSGTAGYGNLPDMVGYSNCDNPTYTPVLYDPGAAPGARFSSRDMPTSTIPRLYHSVATLTASGKVMIAGSNPNPDQSTKKYPTEYRVEWLSPPNIAGERPLITNAPSIADFGAIIRIKLSTADLLDGEVKVVLMDFGFVTHSVHINLRWVELCSKRASATNELLVQMPPSGEIYPPGYGWLFVLVDGTPSKGRRMMIGKGTL